MKHKKHLRKQGGSDPLSGGGNNPNKNEEDSDTDEDIEEDKNFAITEEMSGEWEM